MSTLLKPAHLHPNPLSGFARLNRRTLLASGLGASLLAVTGCGGTDSQSAGGATREISGALGTIKVPVDLGNVVSVGQYRDTDAAVALGVVPVLSPDLSAFMEGGVSPWVQAELGDQELNLIDVSQMPYEAIAAGEPDLILATDRSSLEDEYDQLSQIAPTLSWQEGYNMDDWRTTTTRVGEALGREDEAARQIELTEEAIEAARTANPELDGLTFTFGPVTEDGTVNTINSGNDASAAFFAQLGMELAPAVMDLPQSSYPGRAEVSSERLDLLEADIVLLTFNTPEARTTLEENSLFQAIPAVERGAYVPLDLPAALAMGFPSALSIRWALEEVVPRLRDALT